MLRLEVGLWENMNPENINIFVFLFELFFTRDSMARAVYDKLFAWLVQRLNETIIPKNGENGCMSLGLLDIFGFENF